MSRSPRIEGPFLATTGQSRHATPTGESFNARNYLPSIPGTWQTASVAIEADGTMQPEYHVLFTPAGILYGVNAIPERWLSVLGRRDYLEDMAAAFAACFQSC